LAKALSSVGAGDVAAQYRLPHAVGIDQHAGLGVTLAGAFRDNRRDGLVRELRGDALRLEQTLGMGLAQEKSGAERGYEGRLQKQATFLSPHSPVSGVVLWAAASSV
jgi:hypothetical protein